MAARSRATKNANRPSFCARAKTALGRKDQEDCMKILALIPARGLSDRIPYKNLTNLCGKPLIEWTFDVAKASGVFDVIAVSTEDSRVSYVARVNGVAVIDRPEDMAQPTSPTFDVVLHAFSVVPCDLLMLLQPTSPLRTVK